MAKADLFPLKTISKQATVKCMINSVCVHIYIERERVQFHIISNCSEANYMHDL